MDARRSTRLPIVLPVTLSGTDSTGLAFKENTWTIGVNNHGAKLSTSHRLAVGDPIMVGNTILGNSAQARVVRVVEKGSAFEVGIELLEAQDIWGAKLSPSDRKEDGSVREGDHKAEDHPDPALVRGAEGPSPNPPSATHGHSSSANPSEGKTNDHPTPSGEPRNLSGNKGTRVEAHEPRFESLADFLKTSRAELEGLLAKTLEIHQKSSRALQAGFEEVHAKLQLELEAASAGYVDGLRDRFQREASLALETFGHQAGTRLTTLMNEALTNSRSVLDEVGSKLDRGAEEFRNKMDELSSSALDEFKQKGEDLFDGFRSEILKTFEELKSRSTSEVSDGLRNTAAELADELRRRAEVGLEILIEQLRRSCQTVVEEGEKRLADSAHSALSGLATEASQTVSRQVAVGANALKEASSEVTSGLQSYFHDALIAFQKQVEELSQATVERHRRTSEVLLKDLRSRLDQAARALAKIGGEAGVPGQNPTSE